LPMRAGEQVWDYRILDEKGINKSPFYGEFLAPMDMRYSICGLLDAGSTKLSAFAVQRSARPIETMEHDVREFCLLDDNGYQLSFAQHVAAN
jgi:hypothetical protein